MAQRDLPKIMWEASGTVKNWSQMFRVPDLCFQPQKILLTTKLFCFQSMQLSSTVAKQSRNHSTISVIQIYRYTYIYIHTIYTCVCKYIFNNLIHWDPTTISMNAQIYWQISYVKLCAHQESSLSTGILVKSIHVDTTVLSTNKIQINSSHITNSKWNMLFQ